VNDEAMSLADLAEASGIPARTIRFYIARGLLDGPAKGGRDAIYTGAHLERLERIRKLQSEGRTLIDIGRMMVPRGTAHGLPAPAACWQYQMAEEVVVTVKAGASPWRMRQIQSALAELRQRLAESTSGKEDQK
jgi:DNA-binding transcriptional MerR regulator